MPAIPDGQTYAFSVGGATADGTSVQSCNSFKKNPGVGGLVVNSQTTYEIPAASVALKNAKGGVLTSGTSDEDGWYMLFYKWSGKPTTLYVTLTANGYKSQTKQITLKSNGYVEVDFNEP